MKQDPQQSRDLALHYIERLHTTLVATGASLNRTYVLQCICCIFTVVLSVGLAHSNNLVSVAGMTFYAPLWLIVIGLSVLVSATFAYLIGLSNHLRRVRSLITKLYLNTGFTEPRITRGAAHPLEYPDISSVIADAGLEIGKHPLGLLFRSVNLLILAVTLLLFPVVAQASVGLYLVRTFGWHWPGTLYIVFIMIATLTNCAVFLIVSLRGT